MAEVRFLGCDNDVFCSYVAAYAAEFQQASGHQVTVQLLGNDHYYTNKLTEYLSGDRPADVYMPGPVLAWEQLGRGFSPGSGWTCRGPGRTTLPRRRRFPGGCRESDAPQHLGGRSLEQCLGAAASDIDRTVVRA